jgi:hypothetical protein
MFKSTLLVKTVFLLFNAAVAMTILDLILHAHLASFVIAPTQRAEIFHILLLFLVCYIP